MIFNSSSDKLVLRRKIGLHRFLIQIKEVEEQQRIEREKQEKLEGNGQVVGNEGEKESIKGKSE